VELAVITKYLVPMIQDTNPQVPFSNSGLRVPAFLKKKLAGARAGS
jgi:hypothetical protein